MDTGIGFGYVRFYLQRLITLGDSESRWRETICYKEKPLRPGASQM
jgi:hypothetical protein